MEKLICFIKRMFRQDHLCRHCMKKGVVVYSVFGLDRRSFIYKYTLTRKPRLNKRMGCWFVCARIGDGEYVSDFSLSDAGIIKNNYNSHKSFIKKENAEKYLKECLNQ